MNVISLFDGISCAMVALVKAGFKVENYYASEIDPYAIQVSKNNYPEIQQLGDIKNIKLEAGSRWVFGEVDLLIGGSPCQDLSIAKKNRKGLDGDRSGLFWEFVRILEEVKPKYFVLENVASMDKSQQEIISKTLGVQPILIDAGLVSAQTRKRLFWTNISNVTQPEDKKLFLRDIVEENGIDITQRMEDKVKGTLSYKKTWVNVRRLDQKAKTLTASGQNISNSGATNIDMGDGTFRKLTITECERLQGLKDGYVGGGISSTQGYKCLGNAFNADVVSHLLKFIPKGFDKS